MIARAAKRRNIEILTSQVTDGESVTNYTFFPAGISENAEGMVETDLKGDQRDLPN